MKKIAIISTIVLGLTTTSCDDYLDVLPDNCLDLGRLRYKGINISFLAKNGYIGPSGYTLEEFGRSFYAGMMYTES